MCTGSHLALIIINSLIPLFWTIMLIVHFNRYISLRDVFRDAKRYADNAIKELEGKQTDNEHDERMRQMVLKQHRHFVKSRDWDIRYAKYNMLFWITIALLFIITSTSTLVETAIKLYHHNCPCELRDSKVVEIKVENAKEGPQFSVTANNLRVE